MGYTVTVWRTPPGTPHPGTLEEADAMLARARARRGPAGMLASFRAFGAALYERFPPALLDGDASPCDAWLDGSEAGESDETTLTFGLNLHGPLYSAAVLHAVVQANRLGLNLHDPQSGEHLLADGRVLPEGRPVDAAAADAAWRAVPWAELVAEWRQAIADGSAEAAHDLGACLEAGGGGTRWRTIGTALMQHAAVAEPHRRRRAMAALAALPGELQEGLDALLAQWRSAPALLPALDQALAEARAEREAAVQRPWDMARWNEHDLPQFRRLGADGLADAALRVVALLEHQPALAARWQWRPPAGSAARHLQWAAEAGDAFAIEAVASRLLAGREGWPLDPQAALGWLRRLGETDRRLEKLTQRLADRLARPWDPVADRARALPHLQAVQTAGPDAERALAHLRRACELDHPEAWHRLGEAYFEGEWGLPVDHVVGATLTLVALKETSPYANVVRRHRPPAFAGMDASELFDAVSLARELILHPEPWATIERVLHNLRRRAVFTSGTRADGSRVAESRAGAEQQRHHEGRALAVREARRAAGVSPAARPPAARPAAPAASDAARTPAATATGTKPPLALLWTGVALPLLALALITPLGPWAAVGVWLLVPAGALLGGWSGWQVARGLGRGPLARALWAAGAAAPLLGVFVAWRLTRGVLLRRPP